jgi:hypothetical protein
MVNVKSRDFSLVERAQGGDSRAKYELYHNYTALIRSQSKKASCDAEDFFQDAYECMCRGLDYVKLDKIANPHDWGFYQIFSKFLLKNIYAVNKDAHKEVPTLDAIDDSISKDFFNATIDAAYANNIQFDSATFSKMTTIDSYRLEERLESGYDDFVSSLEGSHFQVLTVYQDTHSMAETARRLKQDYREVSLIIKGLKKKAYKHFKIAEFV